MNRKKIVSFTLALIMASSMFLTACGGTEKKTEEKPATTEAGKTEEKKDSSEKKDAEKPANAVDVKINTTDELTIAAGTQVETYDYVISARTSDHEINANLVDGLLETDETGKIVPAVAESYEKNDDATVWTFKIKPDVKWVTTAGEEYDVVKAEDFVTGVRHGAEFKSGASWLLQGTIKGYSEYVASDFSDAAWEKVGIKAIDDTTLEFTLEQPVPYFDSMCTYTVLYPINKDFLESKGEGCKLGAPNAENCKFGALEDDTILVNGAYLLEENTAKSKIVMVKNDNYWDADNVFLKKVTYIYDEGTDPYAVIKGFENGVYPQAALNTAWEDYDQYLEKYKDYAFYTLPNASCFGVMFNFNRQSFNETNYATDEAQREITHNAILNENFRKALRAAYDAKAAMAVTIPEALAIESLRNVDNFPEAGTQKDGTTYFQAVTKAYKEMTGEDVNLDDGQQPFLSKEKALDYLAKAEAEGVKFPVHLDILVPETSDKLVKEHQSMKKSIEENTDGKIIIELVMRSMETVQNIAYRNDDPAKADYDISTFSGWGPDYADPKSFVDTFSATTGYYLTSIGLEAVDQDGKVADEDIKTKIGMMDYEKYYREADAETKDMDKRYQLFAKADAQLIKSCFFIPTKQQVRGQVVSHYVPFTKPYSPWGASNLKYKKLKLQEEMVTAAERNKLYEEWLKNK